MSKFTITFCLTADREECVVYLLMKDMDPKEMTLKSSNSQMGMYVFEASVEICGVRRFPMTSAYNYTINGAEVFHQERQLVVNRPPADDNIFVNDNVAAQAPRAELIYIEFNLFYQAKRDEVMTIRSDNKVFQQNPADYVSMQSKDGWWSATVPVSCYAVQPIVYKYYLVERSGRVVRSEEGRPHTLFIHAPVGGASVAVYDTWSQMVFGYPYASRSLHPCKTRRGMSAFSVEYVPVAPTQLVYVRGSCPALSGNAGQPEVMKHDVAWVLEKEMPARELGFTFQLGNVPITQEQKCQWIQCPYPSTTRKSGPPPEVVRSRMIWGAPTRRWFCVYAPLVSLRTDETELVGDFGTLVMFAMWAKQCGIGQIHVHLEKLMSNLLDPIHAQIPIVGDVENLTIENVRKLKIQALYERYLDYKRTGVDSRFEMFKVQYPWITSRCQNEFGHWVQSFLFQQLSSAYERIVDMGVQVITDFVPGGSDLRDQIITYTHFCSALRLINFDTFIQGLTVQKVKSIVGESHVADVLRFCDVRGETVHVNPAFVDLRNVYGALQSSVDPQLAKELAPKIQHVAGLYSLVNPRGCTELLSQLTRFSPCALVLDNATTKIFPPKQILEQFGMLPSASQPIQSMFAFAPELLSPEMISQFDQDATPDSILAALNQSVQTGADSVTVYLADFLAAFNGSARTSPNTIQDIPGHRRFQFPVTVQNMQRDATTNEKIAQFLSSCNRKQERGQ